MTPNVEYRHFKTSRHLPKLNFWRTAIWKNTSLAKLTAWTSLTCDFKRSRVKLQSIETLLPLSSLAGASVEEAKEQVGQSGLRVSSIGGEHFGRGCSVKLKIKLFKCFLDAAVSEQVARMTAMKAATENAGDLIKSLSTALQPCSPRSDHR